MLDEAVASLLPSIIESLDSEVEEVIVCDECRRDGERMMLLSVGE